jgi:hypothetical protein
MEAINIIDVKEYKEETGVRPSLLTKLSGHEE